jgi:ribonucleotide reductase class II
MFPKNAPSAPTVFFRSYSHNNNGLRETWKEVCDRTISGLGKLGKLTQEETDLLYEQQLNFKCLSSGRWLWVGGREWIENPANFPGAYNCTSLRVNSLETFGLLMDLAMMGCGTGAVLTEDCISQLPVVKNHITIKEVTAIGTCLPAERRQETTEDIAIECDANSKLKSDTTLNLVTIRVGDSRKGWVTAYQALINLAFERIYLNKKIIVSIDLSSVRPAGEKLKGFGGVSNPIKLPELFNRCAEILNGAIGRKLNSVECCLLIDVAAATIVAGGIRRTAGIRQFIHTDKEGSSAKDNLYVQDENGKWSLIDPKRDVLTMSNHTRIFDRAPTLDECIESVGKQYLSGEGAIQWEGETLVRTNCDRISGTHRNNFLAACKIGKKEVWIQENLPYLHGEIREHRINRNGLNPCGEILGGNFLCNLSEIHLNTINPQSLKEQEQAFKAGAITVAAFLHHKFEHPRLQKSREFDPIVGVSFTGLFDFFVNTFGIKWLQWFAANRPQFYEVSIVEKNIQAICEMFNINIDEYESATETGWNFGALYRDIEEAYLSHWRQIVEKEVRAYCDRHELKCPNRCTTTQPSGCTTKDALRIFDQGLLFADEHMDAAIGECDLNTENLTVRGGIPVLTGIANKELDLVRLTLENGRQLTMTLNHRLSIDGVWVHAEDMLVGQMLDVEVGNYNNAENAMLDYVDIDRSGKPGTKQIGCSLPGRMSPELAYFIGCLFGNGCVSEYLHRLRFSHGNLEILEKISHIGINLFGLKGNLHADVRGGRYELTFSNKQLYEWFVANRIHKPAKSNVLDRIPQKLRMSSQKSLLAFFAGLIDTDGCIRTKGSLSIDSASEPFLRHLQQIGEAIGLSFSIFANTEGTNLQETKAMFGLCLSRMKSVTSAISFINQYSIKARYRPLLPVKRVFTFNPYKIAKIETGIVDYTYDYAVEGENDDDSWYWQGAIKSHNTKSLLTGASPGWHPPKAQWFIRRITIAKGNPIALAAIACGYSVIPAPGDKDENGQLLDDPFDERCTEWLIEIPTAVNWADLPGVEEIDISQFSASAQFDYYMQVQRHYTTHNTSATIEVREHEIDALAKDIYDAIQEDKGYVSAAILARFDDHETYPRLPFEPVSKEMYLKLCQEVEARRTCDDFYIAISKYSSPEEVEGPAACDSDKCLFPQHNPS